MKKNILKVAFVAAIVLVSGINVFNSQKTENLSDVVLANVEALAFDEVGYELNDLNDNCYWYEYKDCYYLIVQPDGNTVWWHSNFEERR